jgi:hypothetical protein
MAPLVQWNQVELLRRKKRTTREVMIPPWREGRVRLQNQQAQRWFNRDDRVIRHFNQKERTDDEPTG